MGFKALFLENPEDVCSQLEEATEKLAQVARDIDGAIEALRAGDGTAEDAAAVKAAAATAVADVARMLQAHGPAAAIAEVTAGRARVSGRVWGG